MASDLKVTQNQHLQEIIKCGRDPAYFIKTYCYIQHPIRGKIKLETYNFQDDCVKAFEDHRLNIVLKSRQLGLSTICAAYALWMALFFKNKNILVIATKFATAQNFTKKVKYALESLPKWLILPNFEYNQKEVRFDNGSKITAIPTSEDAGRSEALSLLIVDEAAFIKNFEEIWTGLNSTISRGGRAIVLSTPNGAEGQYYHLWQQAEAKQSEFNCIKLPWQVHPEQNQEWFDRETRGMSRRQIAQELNCDFLSSGDTFFQADTLEKLKLKFIYGQIDQYDNDLTRWYKSDINKKYIIGADVARGDSTDYSAFYVLQAPDLKIMAEYKGKCRPDKFAAILAKIGKEYNNALIAIENNNIGYMTCSKLQELQYPRLFYESAKDNVFDYRPMKDNEVPGFVTSIKNRDKMLAKLEDVIRNEILIPTSDKLYKELLTFVWSGSRAESARGANDDLIMSLAIAIYVADMVFGSNHLKSANIASTLIKAMSLSRSPTALANVPKNMAVGYGRSVSNSQYENAISTHKWLLN